MKVWTVWLNNLLEFVWNRTIALQHPIEYQLDTTDINRVVTKGVKIGEENKDYIFVSQQISYSRKTNWLRKKARLYRVEVIEKMDDIESKHPSKAYLIPELCSSIFRHTYIPHGCAINFVIDKLESK